MTEFQQNDTLIYFGQSMRNIMKNGERVKLTRHVTPKRGDVIAYYRRYGQRSIHRIIAVDSSGHFQTQGDMNTSADKNLVPPSHLIGRVDAVLGEGGHRRFIKHGRLGLLLAHYCRVKRSFLQALKSVIIVFLGCFFRIPLLMYLAQSYLSSYSEIIQLNDHGQKMIKVVLHHRFVIAQKHVDSDVIFCKPFLRNIIPKIISHLPSK